MLRERDQHIVVLGRHLSHFLFAMRQWPTSLSVSTVRSPRASFALAVVLRELGNRRRLARLEVFRHASSNWIEHGSRCRRDDTLAWVWMSMPTSSDNFQRRVWYSPCEFMRL